MAWNMGLACPFETTLASRVSRVIGDGLRPASGGLVCIFGEDRRWDFYHQARYNINVLARQVQEGHAKVKEEGRVLPVYLWGYMRSARDTN